MIPTNIDWALVGRAVDFYQNRGFKYVEVPWMVSTEAVCATLPDGKSLFSVGRPNSWLVGSAEQSFLQMMIDGVLPADRYVAASPCFRDDPVDDLHAKTFFKVELIDVMSETTKKVDARGLLTLGVMNAARSFFVESVFGLEVINTVGGFDITLNNIEIGSYGYREHKGHSWIYGTGLAEPRFSLARAAKKIGVK